MLGQERDHLASDLKSRDVTVEIDPVQALDIKTYMTIEDLVDIDHHNHHHRHMNIAYLQNAPQLSGGHQRNPAQHLGGQRRNLIGSVCQ